MGIRHIPRMELRTTHNYLARQHGLAIVQFWLREWDIAGKQTFKQTKTLIMRYCASKKKPSYRAEKKFIEVMFLESSVGEMTKK